MLMSGIKDKYGLLPEIPEHIMDTINDEAKDFASLFEHDTEGAKRSLHEEIEWLKENKDFLGKTVETSIEATLGLYSDKLTHKHWVDLQILLLKGVLFVLHSLNEALKEKLSE
jgi:hypothetical protein